jgi:ammonium transporter Rh
LNNDTCGVNNLHGIPGIIGGLSGDISASFTSDELYGDNIGNIFPAMNESRTNTEQGEYQLLTLLTTLLISIFGGMFSGAVLNLGFLANKREYFDDRENWDELDIENSGDQP